MDTSFTENENKSVQREEGIAIIKEHNRKLICVALLFFLFIFSLGICYHGVEYLVGRNYEKVNGHIEQLEEHYHYRRGIPYTYYSYYIVFSKDGHIHEIKIPSVSEKPNPIDEVWVASDNKDVLQENPNNTLRPFFSLLFIFVLTTLLFVKLKKRWKIDIDFEKEEFLFLQVSSIFIALLFFICFLGLQTTNLHLSPTVLGYGFYFIVLFFFFTVLKYKQKTKKNKDIKLKKNSK